jgi:hypothetical protein
VDENQFTKKKKQQLTKIKKGVDGKGVMYIKMKTLEVTRSGFRSGGERATSTGGGS